MPKEHSSGIPARQLPDHGSWAPGASRITVPPTVASVPPPPALPRPPRAFSVSGPPPAWSIATALTAAMAAIKESVGPRGSWLLAGGSTLVAAMISCLFLGQTLSSHAPDGSTNGDSPHTALPPAPESVLIVGAPGAATPPGSGTVQATGPTVAASAPPVSGAPSVLEVCAPAATFRAPRPNHHSEHPADAKPAPKPVASAAPVVSAVMAKAPRSHDSLDDLIRKAASN